MLCVKKKLCVEKSEWMRSNLSACRSERMYKLESLLCESASFLQTYSLSCSTGQYGYIALW